MHALEAMRVQVLELNEGVGEGGEERRGKAGEEGRGGREGEKGRRGRAEGRREEGRKGRGKGREGTRTSEVV
jgi:hypothetical protein